MENSKKTAKSNALFFNGTSKKLYF